MILRQWDFELASRRPWTSAAIGGRPRGIRKEVMLFFVLVDFGDGKQHLTSTILALQRLPESFPGFRDESGLVI